MSGEGKVVCVTGASGYIASWLVKLLLDRGYTVHATIRSLDDLKKTEHLLAFDGSKERLSLFEANLTAEGSFDSAVNGCVCVFHTVGIIVIGNPGPIGTDGLVTTNTIIHVQTTTLTRIHDN
ncbi:putative cinnamyl-alcohol dehydrogenase [Helianthus annuus]|nr:putative cinnamyl-alcohol dehydrogenase [Helianthus annuus]